MRKLLLTLLLALPIVANAATVTPLVGTGDTTVSPNTSASFTPAANLTLFCYVGVFDSVETTPDLVLSSSQGGQSFTHVTRAAASTNTSYLHLFVSNAQTTNTSQTVTITGGADAWTGTNIACFGVDITRVGSSAVKQTAIQENQSSGATPTTNFGASALTGNPTLFGVRNGVNPATITPPTSWTEDATFGDIGHATPDHGLATSYRNSGFTGTQIQAGSTYGSNGSALAVEIDASAVGTPVSFTSGPTVAAAANGYTISGTVNGSGFGALVVESVGVNPGAPAPTCTQIKAGQDGNGAAAPLNNSETWTTDVANDFLLTLSGAWPKHDVHTCATDGTNDTAVTSSNDQLRSEDASQGIVTLTSVAATSPFAVQTVANCDTTSASATVTGCGDTSWLEPGMKVDLSAGFADLTDIIVEAVTSTTITFENAANSTTANITVTQDTYFSPAVATGDVIEGNDTNSAGETMTVEVDGDLIFTPAAQTYRTWAYNIQDVSDTVDGDFDAGPPAWTTGDDTLHFFSTRPDFDQDLGQTAFLFYKDVALSGVNLECSDVDGQTTSVTSRSSPPTGTTIATTGAWTGTPTVEDETGVTLTLDCEDSGDLFATPQPIDVYVTDDSVTTPDCVGDTIVECAAKLDIVRPWRSGVGDIVATFAYSTTVAIGDIISQDPTTPSTMTATESLDVVVSLGNASAWVSYARVWMFKEVRRVYLTTTAFKNAVEADLRGSQLWTRWEPGTLPWSGSSNMQIQVIAIPGVPPLYENGRVRP